MIWTVLFLIALSCVRYGLAIAERSADPPNPHLRLIGEAMESLIIAVTLIFLVIRPFVVQAYYIPSESMAPTLRRYDRILVNKLSYRLGEPQRDEVVVFRAPKEATRNRAEGEEEAFIKRVIALPGDIVEVQGGQVYVNGRRIREPFVKEPTQYDFPPYIVPEGKLFVMGDNRNHSNDSHRWGALDRERLIGKAICIFWPPSHAGGIR